MSDAAVADEPGTRLPGSRVGEASTGLLFRYLSASRLVTIAQIEGRVRGAGSEFVLALDREHQLLANCGPFSLGRKRRATALEPRAEPVVSRGTADPLPRSGGAS